MGIDVHNLRALSVAARHFDVDFKSSVMLGRQGVHCTPAEINRLFRPLLQDQSFEPPQLGAYAEPLFKALGAATIDSIDASDFEGASIIADFGEALPIENQSRYSFYCDFGTIEHIFNVPTALANISALLDIGGHALTVTNSNGFIGHGLYQFSPEFFYSAFSERNGFKDPAVFLVDLGRVSGGKNGGRWLHVRDPRKTGIRSRCGLIPECYVVCIAQKVANTKKFHVMQSDYQDFLWQQQVG